MRILFALPRYPQYTATYMETELRWVAKDHEICVVSLGEPDTHADEYHPFTRIGPQETDRFVRLVAEFRPDIVHGHLLHYSRLFAEIAEAADAKFTVRAHSFDVLTDRLQRHAPETHDAIASDRCAGVLAMPFALPILREVGLPAAKLIPSRPVIDFLRFYDTAPNGAHIMNVGACLPKKGMEEYLTLACQMPALEFNLYAVGYQIADLAEKNAELGYPVKFSKPVPHRAMPGEYKRHQWLIYTCSKSERAVGWPVSIAEAQAAGVGVCMQALRPDLRDYVGPDVVLYDEISDLVDVVSAPPSPASRESGFEIARRSDIRSELPRLYELWSS